MRRGLRTAVGIAGASALIVLAGCTTDPSVEPADEGEGAQEAPAEEWFDQEVYDKQFKEREVVPEGPEDKPYLQMINPEMGDTSEFKSDGGKKMCFANASISNPWRQTGWITMNEQLGELKKDGVITEMETRDA
ncbi:MAG: ABC transporter substrate-binding protein, partial [Brevibacterium aurantiacum]|nr:ABC transporter substrate-binding protein [Brevibacterium sp.]